MAENTADNLREEAVAAADIDPEEEDGGSPEMEAPGTTENSLTASGGKAAVEPTTTEEVTTRLAAKTKTKTKRATQSFDPTPPLSIAGPFTGREVLITGSSSDVEGGRIVQIKRTLVKKPIVMVSNKVIASANAGITKPSSDIVLLTGATTGADSVSTTGTNRPPMVVQRRDESGVLDIVDATTTVFTIQRFSNSGIV
jgi:hypothetical protein